MIYYNEEFKDFAARVEFKLPPGGNNGLAIRYPGHGDTAYDGHVRAPGPRRRRRASTRRKLDPRQAHGSAYGMVAAKRGYLRPVGQWNFEEVTVKGSKIKVELNGTVILDTDLSHVKEFMANSPHPGKDRTSGYFGFAGHSDPVEFRNIVDQAAGLRIVSRVVDSGGMPASLVMPPEIGRFGTSRDLGHERRSHPAAPRDDDDGGRAARGVARLRSGSRHRPEGGRAGLRAGRSRPRCGR